MTWRSNDDVSYLNIFLKVSGTLKWCSGIYNIRSCLILWKMRSNHTKKRKKDHNVAHKGTKHTSPTSWQPKPTCHCCACVILQCCSADDTSHQMTHTVISYLQAAKDLRADNTFNFCTTGITLCLDHTSNHISIPLKSLHVIVAQLIACMTKQLRLLVRPSDSLCCKWKLHGIKDLPKTHRSVWSRRVSISPEVLSLTPSCLTNADVDLQR
jgi:hypothetical protein